MSTVINRLNPEELEDVCEVIRKAVDYERILRLQNYEEVASGGDQKNGVEAMVFALQEDYIIADKAKWLWGQLEKSLLSPSSESSTTYGTIACGGNKL